MTKKELLHNGFSFGFILIAISSVVSFIQLKTGLPIGNTILWWGIHALFLIVTFKLLRTVLPHGKSRLMIFVFLYLLWNVFSLLRGGFVAETYWDWKGLVGNSMALLLPVVAYAASDPELIKKVLRLYVFLGLPLFFCIALLISKAAYGFYLVPVSFLALFFPVLTRKSKVTVLFFIFLVLTADLSARSNVIKFFVPLVFSMIFYFRHIFRTKFFLLCRSVLFFLPIVFFYLGISGTFNIFNMSSYVDGDYDVASQAATGEVVDSNLAADTRTFLYEDVLYTAKVYSSWVIGRSPARGNLSKFFSQEDMNNRGERFANEVAILNVFTWTGLIGVILYGLAFFGASTIAISQSNNYFCKILGLFIAFRWAYAWVEDINNFTLNTVVLWVMIGLCYSKRFRGMTNDEISLWVREIFRTKKRIVW
jgi:hypothetical protein